MSHLEQRLSVACPLAQAGVRLAEFFKAHGNANGDTARLSLRVSVNVPGIRTPVALRRAVIATLQKHSLPADMAPRYRVQWAPENGGPFPLFAGEILVEGGDDYNSFILYLQGDYTPPLGIAGAGFDYVIGNHVAHNTAADLLHNVRDFIEKAFSASEANKQGAPEPSRTF